MLVTATQSVVLNSAEKSDMEMIVMRAPGVAHHLASSLDDPRWLGLLASVGEQQSPQRFRHKHPLKVCLFILNQCTKHKPIAPDIKNPDLLRAHRISEKSSAVFVIPNSSWTSHIAIFIKCIEQKIRVPTSLMGFVTRYPTTFMSAEVANMQTHSRRNALDILPSSLKGSNQLLCSELRTLFYRGGRKNRDMAGSLVWQSGSIEKPASVGMAIR